MADAAEIHRSLIHGLQGWMILSVSAGLFGLYFRPGELARGFWLMTGLWGVVDGIIAWRGFASTPANLDYLATVLFANTFLNVLYIVVGVILAGRHSPLLRGFGWAIIVQGAFLLAFDLYFYQQCQW